MTGYELSRAWFDWSFDNPEKISPNHTAIYFFAIEHNNRLGWRKKFGFPSQMTMDAIGIKRHQTYIKYFNDLVEWGFIELVQKSTNQYSANIISLASAMPKSDKALDKAFINHASKQTRSNSQSNGSIDKQSNNITNNNITSEDLINHNNFEDFLLSAFAYLGKVYVRGNPTTHIIEADVRRWLVGKNPGDQKKNLEAYMQVTEKKYRKKDITGLLEKLDGYNYCHDLKASISIKPNKETKEEQIKKDREIREIKAGYERVKKEVQDKLNYKN